MSNATYELTLYIAGKGARYLGKSEPSLAGHIWFGLSGQSQSFGFAPKVPPKETLLPVEGRRVEIDKRRTGQGSVSLMCKIFRTLII